MVFRVLLAFLIFPGFLFTGVVGLMLTWLDRKVSARLQWRVGPPFYQPFADFFKLLLKETVIPDGAPRGLYLGAPGLGLVGATMVAVLLFWASFSPQLSFAGDLIVVLYFLSFPPLAVIIGGSASRNPLASVGASREMSLYFAYELPLLIGVFTAVVKTGSIRLAEMVQFQAAQGPVLYSISGVIAFLVCLICTQAKLGMVPFDIPEAEQEVMAGPYIEYSGVPLALFRLTRAMMFLLMPVLLVTVFWGGLTSPWAIPKLLLLALLIILIKNTNPRLRIDQALKLFWFGLGIPAAIGMILALSGL